MPISGTFCRVRLPTILFADADADARFVYHSVAADAGFGVELASDGYEAVALAHFALPDLIVLETRLAGYDGFDVIRRLRASPLTEPIPIVIASSEDGAAYEEQVRASGGDGWLTKPFSAEVLLRLAAVLLICHRREPLLETPGLAACDPEQPPPLRAIGRST